MTDTHYEGLYKDSRFLLALFLFGALLSYLLRLNLGATGFLSKMAREYRILPKKVPLTTIFKRPAYSDEIFFISSILLLPYCWYWLGSKSLWTGKCYFGRLRWFAGLEPFIKPWGPSPSVKTFFCHFDLVFRCLLINRLVIKSHIGKEKQPGERHALCVIGFGADTKSILSPEMLASPFVIHR